MVLGVIFSYMGTLIHAHIYPVILSPPSSSTFTSYASFNFLFCGNFWCFHFWQEFCPGLRCLSVYMQCVPEAESHCFFSWCYRLFCDSALMLPQTLHELPGFQALFNSLTLPSAVGTHRSGLCPHSQASLCCAR